MKTTITNLLTAICISGLLLSAAAQPAALLPPVAPDQPAAAPPDATGAAAGTDAVPTTAPAVPDAVAPNDGTAVPVPPPTPVVILPTRGSAPTAQPVASLFTPPEQPIGTNQNDLTLSYNRAPLEMVLSYLSDAAGLIVVMEVQPRNAYITVKGSHLTKLEAIDLLNAELNRNNYAAVRNERTLTIMTKDEARQRMIPVKTGNDWQKIPNNAEIATWIIPIQFVDAGQLVTELQSFVSMQATIVADPNGNSVIITDTQANIRHLGQIMKMVDDSAKMETVVKTFKLEHASPTDVANELANLFPTSNGAGGGFQVQGGRGGGGGGGLAGLLGGGGGRGGGGGTTSQRVQKAQQINVVPDARLSAVVVTAPQDVMDRITELMVTLDVPSDRDQKQFAYPLKNADPNDVVAVLQGVFGSTSTQRTGSSANSALQQRSQNAISSLGNAQISTGIGSSGTGRGN